MRRVLLLIRTVCTDFGVEMHTVDVPDITGAFMARLRGDSIDNCRVLVNPRTRLLPMALRLSGWSHLWGNIMKSVAKGHPHWPEILEASRELCRFWRVEG